MTVLCPIHGVAASTAYAKKRCRCETCMARKREATAALRERPVWLPSDEDIQARYADLFAEADAAFRTDNGYMFAIARAASEAVDNEVDI